jgi:two-component system alkaline phosphatase synthesis response regulator PhoP
MRVLESESVLKSESVEKKDAANILLVDDEPDFLIVMEKLLKKHGYNVSEATNGMSALKKAKQERPDAVLLDVMMGDMSGWDVCKDLKNNPATKDMPIIMLTVMAEDDSIKRSFEYADADWHITKPFDTDALFFILDMMAKGEGKSEIERKISKMVDRDKKMRKVLEMINPKLIEHKYDFLKSNLE